MERAVATQPFIDNDTHGVLITGGNRMGLNLLGGHVGDSSRRVLSILGVCTMGEDGNAKVAEQDLIISPQQHIFRFDVAMNHLFLVRILQSLSYLLDVGNDDIERKLRPMGVALTKVATGSIVHDQKRGCTFNPEIQNLDDMWMTQARNSACLGKKAFDFLIRQLSMQHFNRSLRI